MKYNLGVPLRLAPQLAALLRCPRCKGPLALSEEEARCAGCALAFPVESGVPLLLDEARSIFAHREILAERQMPSSRPAPAWKRALARLIPSLGSSPNTAANFSRLVALLQQGSEPASQARRVLVVGGGVLGEGIEALVQEPGLELVESDVFLGPRNQLVCDGHDLPFADATFDGAVIQAVLEHVVEPARVTEELHRVLKPGGLVYAETPFMQQVHLGRYDFTRFTHLGHRRLFRRFDELGSGACGGTAMALGWALRAFLQSPLRSGPMRAAAAAAAAFLLWPLRWLDRIWLDSPGTLDGASGLYFLGRRSETTLSDRALISGYRGAQ